MVILKGISDFFALALPLHVFDPFLSFFYYCRASVRLPVLNRLVCTSGDAAARAHSTADGSIS